MIELAKLAVPLNKTGFLTYSAQWGNFRFLGNQLALTTPQSGHIASTQVMRPTRRECTQLSVPYALTTYKRVSKKPFNHPKQPQLSSVRPTVTQILQNKVGLLLTKEMTVL